MNLVMKQTEDLIQVEWFGRESMVFACLSHMIADGWVPSTVHCGVVYEDKVARPVKKEGDASFTGVALFNV